MTTRSRRWARRNPLIVSFAVLVFFSMFVGYGEDIQSCRRTAVTRQSQDHNIGLFQRMFRQDALRAAAYARIDPNPRGAIINALYAGQHASLAAQLHVPPVPSCFPLPGT